MKIIIEGVSQRAKNRIRENGNVFFLLRELENTVLLSTTPAIDDFAWFGWFKNDEIKITKWVE